MSTVALRIIGTTNEIEIIANCKGVLLKDRSKIIPFCLTGGEPGSRGKEYLIRQVKKHKLPVKGTIDLLRGEIYCIETLCDGGYGEEA